MNYWEQFKRFFKGADVTMKFIIINVAIFVLVNVIDSLFYFMAVNFSTVEWFAVPAHPMELLMKPWTVFSYMFLHENLWHIAFNMLWLFIFGRIFLQFLSAKQLVNVYIMGGVSGALLYIGAYNLFPVFANELPASVALGASASVLAITIAIASFSPDFEINLMLIGRVKIKYVAIVAIVLDLVSLTNGNTGGHIAHLGGAAFGLFFTTQIKKQRNPGQWVSKYLEQVQQWFKPRQRFKVSSRNTNRTQKMTDADFNYNKKKEQALIDKILEKVKKTGYSSLTQKEKELLFRASDKN